MKQNYVLGRWSVGSFVEEIDFEMPVPEFLVRTGAVSVLETLGVLQNATQESLKFGMRRLWNERRGFCGIGRSVPFWGRVTREDYDSFIDERENLNWILYPVHGEWRFVAAMGLDDIREIQVRRPFLAGLIETEAEQGPNEEDDDFRLVREGAESWRTGFANLFRFFEMPASREEEERGKPDFPYFVEESNMNDGETHSLIKVLVPYLYEISDRKNGSLSPHWMVNGGQTEVQRRKRGKFANIEYKGKKYKIGCYQNQNEPAPVYWARILDGVPNSPAYQLISKHS